MFWAWASRLLPTPIPHPTLPLLVRNSSRSATQTQQIYDELATQTQALDQTAGEITQKQQEIADGQAKLSTYVAGEYKTGGLSLLQVLTGVDDLSDMLNRLFYIRQSFR